MRAGLFQHVTLGAALFFAACAPEPDPPEETEEPAAAAEAGEEAQAGTGPPPGEADEEMARTASGESAAPPPPPDPAPARVDRETDTPPPAFDPRGIVPPPPFADDQPGTTTVRVRMDPPLSELGEEWLAGEEGKRDFSMPLPDGSEAVVRVDRFVAIGDNGGEFQGSLDGYPDSRVSLSYRGGAEVGAIRIPSENRLIRIMPGTDGEVVMTESEIPEDDPPLPPPGLTVPDEPPPDFVPEPPPGLGGDARERPER
ncbi:MAG: hypothetical protein ACLFRP_00460 [Puniceicoccaceae bacterium]